MRMILKKKIAILALFSMILLAIMSSIKYPSPINETRNRINPLSSSSRGLCRRFVKSLVFLNVPPNTFPTLDPTPLPIFLPVSIPSLINGVSDPPDATPTTAPSH